MVMLIGSWDYVLVSWARLEESREAGGLPGLYLLKTVIWAFCILVGMQGLSMMARSALVLGGDESFAAGGEEGEGV